MTKEQFLFIVNSSFNALTSEALSSKNDFTAIPLGITIPFSEKNFSP